MRLRVMTADDIPAGVRLNTLAGWNQTEHDWKRLLLASPIGCFVMEDGATVVGTATTLCYAGRFAWIGMVLVDPEFRNRGIGTRLLERTIEYLDEIGIPTMKLDATPLGRPLYEKLGFVEEYEIARWTLRRTITEERDVNDRQPAARHLAEIFLYDHELFGADRSTVLRSIAEQAPRLTLSVGGSNLQGYAFGRHGLFADHLGPWMAQDRDTAERTLAHFLERSSRDTVIVDAPRPQPIAGEILRCNGFAVTRPLTRMYRGPNKYPGKSETLCAILGPEFG